MIFYKIQALLLGFRPATSAISQSCDVSGIANGTAAKSRRSHSSLLQKGFDFTFEGFHHHGRMM